MPFAWNVLRRLVREIEKEHDPRRAPMFICLPRQIPPTPAHRAGGVGDAVPRGLGSAQTLGARRIHFARAGPILRPKGKVQEYQWFVGRRHEVLSISI